MSAVRALNSAAQRESPDALACLLDSNSEDFDINGVDERSHSPLWIAINYERVANVKLLLANGAKIEPENVRQVTRCCNVELASLLLEHPGVRVLPKHVCAIDFEHESDEDCRTFLQFLHSRGVDLTAAWHTHLVKIDEYSTTTDDAGDGPVRTYRCLHQATAAAAVRCVELLLSVGCDPDALAHPPMRMSDDEVLADDISAFRWSRHYGTEYSCEDDEPRVRAVRRLFEDARRRTRPARLPSECVIDDAVNRQPAVNHAAESHYASASAVASLEAAYRCDEVVAQRTATLGMLGLVPGEVVLDIGCGPGQLSTELAREVGPSGRACGVDTSPAMIARAHARRVEEALPAVDFTVGSAVALPFESATFDAIVCVQTLCYVPEPSRALREMHRVLRPGGRALILDTDWRTRILATSDAARMDRVLSAVDSAFGFADRHLPPKLPALAAASGLRAADVRGFTLARAGSFDATSYFDVGAWAPHAEGQGVPSEEVRAWLEEQQALSADGGFFFSCTRTMLLLRRDPTDTSPARKRPRPEGE